MGIDPIQIVFFDLGETLVTSHRSWLPGAKEIIKSLKDQEFKLGIISNTGGLPNRPSILNLLPTDFDLSLFESNLILFSSEVGTEKPSPQIFDDAMQRTGLPPKRCLYCSENAVETLIAQAIGMRALRVMPRNGIDLAAIPATLATFHVLT